MEMQRPPFNLCRPSVLFFKALPTPTLSLTHTHTHTHAVAAVRQPSLYEVQSRGVDGRRCYVMVVSQIMTL